VTERGQGKVPERNGEKESSDTQLTDTTTISSKMGNT